MLNIGADNRSTPTLEHHELRYFYDWIYGFSVRGRPLASSMNEKDIKCSNHVFFGILINICITTVLSINLWLPRFNYSNHIFLFYV